jgi:amidohydrolase
MDLLSKAEGFASELIEVRRDLHAHPELSFQERRTSSLVADKLKRLGYEVRTGVGVTGCVGEIVTGPGRTVALRADMDALPIQEANEVAYRSLNHGVMHACGHDAHVSCLLGAARLLAESARSGALPSGRVRLLFQPSEELKDEDNVGGAERMIEDGAMEGVDAVIGLHVASESPTGQLLFRDGVLMAGNDTLRGTIRGTNAHAALPHEGVDAILLTSHVISAVQGIVARRIDPLESAVITFGRIEGGTAENVICGEVRLEGTLRYFSPEVREQLHQGLRDAFAIADALGGAGEIQILAGNPPVDNDSRLNDLVRSAAAEVVGPDNVLVADQIMGAEDFAFLAQQSHGCFFWLGARIEGDPRSHHSPRFDIDERCLPRGAAVLAAAAQKILAEW